MNKLFYPAIFHQEENSIWVSFPDLPECLTEGTTIEDAYEQAVDCLGISLSYKEDNKLDFPKASHPKDITITENAFIIVIEFDMLAYKRRTNSKAVKKTLTIPEWLNEEAISKGVNFSQVLQEALVQKIATF